MKSCFKCIHFNPVTQRCKVFNLPPWTARAENTLCGKDGFLFREKDCNTCTHLKNFQCSVFGSQPLSHARSEHGYCGPDADFFLYKDGAGDDITPHHHIIDQ